MMLKKFGGIQYSNDTQKRENNFIVFHNSDIFKHNTNNLHGGEGTFHNPKQENILYADENYAATIKDP